ncbi:MAG: NAD(P)H-dependent oxidoreductase [Methylobacterium mesophilicum]|nr:NAD(P)H-dependent oxidoreductase [Methylobacterium mesophilicum]
MAPRILVFAGSTRIGATSGRFAACAAHELGLQGAEVTRIDLGDYPLPLMNEDLEREEGIPQSALRLGRQIAGHQGFLVATPEYNHSIPPLLKNAVDWVSRIKRDGERPLRPFENRVAALCSSSSGQFAGIRAANHLRAVLVACGVEVISVQCSVGHGGEAFEEDGALRDERSRKTLTKVAQSLIFHARGVAALDTH